MSGPLSNLLHFNMRTSIPYFRKSSSSLGRTLLAINKPISSAKKITNPVTRPERVEEKFNKAQENPSLLTAGEAGLEALGTTAAMTDSALYAADKIKPVGRAVDALSPVARTAGKALVNKVATPLAVYSMGSDAVKTLNAPEKATRETRDMIWNQPNLGAGMLAGASKPISALGALGRTLWNLGDNKAMAEDLLGPSGVKPIGSSPRPSIPVTPQPAPQPAPQQMMAGGTSRGGSADLQGWDDWLKHEDSQAAQRLAAPRPSIPVTPKPAPMLAANKPAPMSAIPTP